MVLCLMHLFHWYLIGGGKLATACADPQPRSVDRRWVDDGESPSLVLVINDTKLLMPCVKCFELGISNTCDEGVCGKEW
jgi:hypothetical protein